MYIILLISLGQIFPGAATKTVRNATGDCGRKQLDSIEDEQKVKEGLPERNKDKKKKGEADIGRMEGSPYDR